MSDPHPLLGRTALVTGVSRRRGIGFAVARRLAELGASLVIHHHAPHDAEQPWGGDDLDAVRGELAAALHPSARLDDVAADLADPAELIGWLATDRGAWVVGQVLTSDGGFSLG